MTLEIRPLTAHNAAIAVENYGFHHSTRHPPLLGGQREVFLITGLNGVELVIFHQEPVTIMAAMSNSVWFSTI